MATAAMIASNAGQWVMGRGEWVQKGGIAVLPLEECTHIRSMGGPSSTTTRQIS